MLYSRARINAYAVALELSLSSELPPPCALGWVLSLEAVPALDVALAFAAALAPTPPLHDSQN